MTTELRKANKASLRKATTEQLVRKLNDLWGMTPAKLRMSARILAELERREYDVRFLNRGTSMMRWMRLIAANALLPEVVAAFYHHSADLVNAIGRLSIGDQRSLLESGVVTIVIGDVVEDKPLAKLSEHDIQIAFASDHIRSEDEQRQLFAPKPIVNSQTVEPKREPHFRVRPAPEKGGYEVGKMTVAAEEFVQAQAKAIAGAEIPEADPDDPKIDTEAFHCFEFERQALKAIARKTGKTVSRVIREAIWAQYGVILNKHKPSSPR